jgi:glycosyltransferase involved in cell wall biosynthesis
MLSIVIPTFNEEESLPRLLASLKAQEFRDFEVVVADAKSADRTREIALAAGARVVDGGMPGAGRNRGAAVARGEAVLFLDADVVLPSPAFLRTAMAEFRRRKLGTATCRVDALSSRPVDKLFHGAFNAFMLVTERLAPHAPGFCIFARKDVHDAIRGFDEDIRLAEDHDYVTRAARAGMGRFGVLRGCRIPVSVRRFDRDGRFNTALKFMLCELYIRTRGPVKTDMFRYSFGHAPKAAKKERSVTSG